MSVVRERRRAGRTRTGRRRAWGALAALLVVAIAAGVALWLLAGTPSHKAPRRRREFEVPAWSLVATLRRPVRSYSGPSVRLESTFIPARWADEFLALPVLATRPGWIDVRFVARPGHRDAAWIRRSSAVVTESPYRIVVDESRRLLLLFRRARLMMCSPVAAEGSASPTPLGVYFVALVARPPAPGMGSFIVVTSSVVDGVTGWEQSGYAMVMIAGSSSLGPPSRTVTTSSVRLPITEELQLRPVPLGTPIDVVATLRLPLSRRDEELCASRHARA